MKIKKILNLTTILVIVLIIVSTYTFGYIGYELYQDHKEQKWRDIYWDCWETKAKARVDWTVAHYYCQKYVEKLKEECPCG